MTKTLEPLAWATSCPSNMSSARLLDDVAGATKAPATNAFMMQPEPQLVIWSEQL